MDAGSADRARRDQLIVSLRRDERRGVPEIAARVGLTRQRVWKILTDQGVAVETPREAWQRRVRQSRDRADQRRDEILSLYRGGDSPARIAKRLELTIRSVCELLDASLTDRDRALASRNAALRRGVSGRRYSDEQLVAAIHQAAELLGRAPTGPEYRAVYRRLGLPSPALIVNRLGWANAVHAAGLAGGVSHGSRRRWETQECLAAVRSVADEIGRFPTPREYDSIARRRAELPSSSTVRKRCGGWSEARLVLTVASGRNG